MLSHSDIDVQYLYDTNNKTSPYWELYGVFNPYIMIDDHRYDGNHINGILDLADKGIGVRQSFIYWAVWARWIDYNIDEKS